jgi:hypothetical protein
VSKIGDLEGKDALRRRIDEATQYVSIDRLALSPQCGFASTAAGNLLTYEQQWARLARVVEVASDVGYSVARRYIRHTHCAAGQGPQGSHPVAE